MSQLRGLDAAPLNDGARSAESLGSNTRETSPSSDSSPHGLLFERTAMKQGDRFDVAAAFAHDVKHHLMIAEELVKLLHTAKKDREKVVTRLERTVKRLLLETNSVLLAGKAEAGLLHGSTLKTNLNELVTECIEEIGVLFETAGRSIVFSPAKKLPKVPVDPALFPNLLNNLLDNALKYGDDSEPVRVETFTKGDKVGVRITSPGGDLQPNEVEKLFQPFERGTNATGKAGTGLGLYIVRRIAEAHGGSAQVVECGKERTSVEVLLPGAA